MQAGGEGKKNDEKKKHGRKTELSSKERKKVMSPRDGKQFQCCDTSESPKNHFFPDLFSVARFESYFMFIHFFSFPSLKKEPFLMRTPCIPIARRQD